MQLMVALLMIVVSFGLIGSVYAILGPVLVGPGIAALLDLLIGMLMAAACIIVAAVHRSPHLPVKFHAFHPSALCPSWQKTFCCRTFAPAPPVYPAASLRDFSTGALTRCGSVESPLDSRTAHLLKSPCQC